MPTEPHIDASRSHVREPVRRGRPGAGHRRGTAPSLDIAAKSILDSQAFGGTVADVVAERALDHHWDGLFQYAAIRVGLLEAGTVLAELSREERAVSPDTEREPSPRGHLYRRLRDKLEAHPGRAVPLDSSFWWVPRDAELRRGVVALRHALSPRQREILELRHARALRVAEVAHVVGRTEAEVQDVLEQGTQIAAGILGERPRSRDRTLAGALLETFALHPRRASAPRRKDRESVLKVGDVVAARYEVEALLGAGAFADVYRARDRDVTDHVVALKILRTRSADVRSVEVALRELQLIASVFHPSVVQLKDHGWHDGHLWFVMPLYRGETLRARLERGPLGREEARRIFEPLAEALATMHRTGVLHQDIKPENVFLAYLDQESPPQRGRRRVLPVLLDLGVAAKNAELVLAGTPAYLAPEVAARFAGRPDPPVIGPKADVFSLALTLRQALDPESLEEAPVGTVDAFIRYRAQRAPAPPSGRHLQDLRACFERWLHFSPDQRPTAEELGRELAALTRTQERRKRRMAVVRSVAPIAIAVLTLFGAAVYHLSREASLQRTEATHARQRVATVSKNLMRQQSQRRALEADVARLREQYQQSRMTREQLAARLAETEGRLQVAEQRAVDLQGTLENADLRLRELRKERERLSQDQQQRTSELNEARQQLQQTQAKLEGERARHREAAATAAKLRKELQVYKAALEEKTKQLEAGAWRDSALWQLPERFTGSGGLGARSSSPH